jgi:hypothetical protein
MAIGPNANIAFRNVSRRKSVLFTGTLMIDSITNNNENSYLPPFDKGAGRILK